MEQKILGILETLVDKVDSMQTQVSGMQTQMDGMQGQINNIENKVETIENKVKAIENKVEIIEKDVKEIDRKVTVIFNQTADLTEFKTATSTSLERIEAEMSSIEKVTAKNCYDITHLKMIR